MSPREDQLDADEIVLAAQYADAILRERNLVELGRLNRSPKKNWVDNDPAGKGLPRYIEDIALALERKGMPLNRAIPAAINRVKRWARGGDNVKADTVAKATAALAQWTALKARAKARRAAD